MSDLRIGILGASGQVGSRLLELLSATPETRAVGVCRSELLAAALVAMGLEARCGTVDDPMPAAQLLGDCDVLVNCVRSTGSPLTVWNSDTALAGVLMRLADKAIVVHLSSIAVYGRPRKTARQSFERPRPPGRYGREKLFMEHLLLKKAGARAKNRIVLRMGHVYGPGQAWSRAVVDLILDRRQRLPFDGQLPSNAVHIANVAAAIRSVADRGIRQGTYNLLDSPTTSWRQVFDWHAHSIQVSPVAPMSAVESANLAETCKPAETSLARGAAREIWHWFASLPKSFFAANPSLREIAVQPIISLGSKRIETRLKISYLLKRVGSSPPVDSDVPPPSWLLSEDLPGPALDYPGVPLLGQGPALDRWYRTHFDPEAIVRSFQ